MAIFIYFWVIFLNYQPALMTVVSKDEKSHCFVFLSETQYPRVTFFSHLANIKSQGSHALFAPKCQKF